jgi:integrase
VKTGVQVFCKSVNKLDSGPFDKLRVPSLSRDFRQNDGKGTFPSIYESINTQDYLWTIVLTMGRVGEINRLTWHDVDFENRQVALYTRKKKGGHLTPRKDLAEVAKSLILLVGLERLELSAN